MPNRILIITDTATDAHTLKTALGKADDGPFKIEWAKKLSTGLKRIHKGGIDAILVDLKLPDSNGIATFDALYADSPDIPILTLSLETGEKLAREAVARGAQGYLTKGHFNNALVPQSLRNIIQRKAVEDSFHKEKTRAEITLNSIYDAVIGTDVAGNVEYLNAAAEKMTGWPREEAEGQPVRKIFKTINAVTRLHQKNTLELVLEHNKPIPLPANTILIQRDGGEVPIEDSAAPIRDSRGRLVGAVIVFHDVSAAAKLAVKLAHQAQHDSLTNLPNRLLLNDRIEQAIALAKRNGNELAVLYLDLDNFKHINDSLGHAMGDRLLKSVAKRLNACVRKADTVSRQGGDEFVLLLNECRNIEGVTLITDKIITELGLPHSLGQSELQITTSMGISIYPSDGKDAETLIKNADTAMYNAKSKGRNNYQFFRRDMNLKAVERQSVEANLRQALDKQEFFLLYQPKVNLDTGLITGIEALLRWKHPKWGMVLPERFIKIAEDCGLIVPIGRWVLRTACKQAKQWVDEGLGPIHIAVNISPLEFRQKNFLRCVNIILEETGLEACCLQLEITEGVLMDDAESSIGLLYDFKNMGVELAVDDFGTGYSSLSYLKQFPIDVLKIDKSFVNDILSPSDDGSIVSAVIAMGSSLKMRVIAEGIENKAQLAFLKNRHCDEGQGYFFGKPVDASQFAVLLRANMPEVAYNS